MKSLVFVSTLVISIAAQADLVADVRCREVSFSQAAESRDAKAFAAFIDADARFVGAAVNRGPQDVAAAWSVFFGEDGPTIKWRPQIVEVLENGVLALSRGPFRLITKDSVGNESEQWGTFNSIWRLNADGQWRVVFDAGSDAAETPSNDVKSLLDMDDDCG